MKLIPRLVIASFLMCSLSCEKGDAALVWMWTNETQCANPWDSFEASTVEDKVTSYLNSEGILAHDVDMKDHPCTH